jgi:hypothetical protein
MDEIYLSVPVAHSWSFGDMLWCWKSIYVTPRAAHALVAGSFH